MLTVTPNNLPASRSRLMMGAALSVVALSATPMFAQAAPSTGTSATIETVVVTAERRSTNLQTTGIAATVLTAADLEKKNITNIDQLQFTTPNLIVQDTGGAVLLNIRGIGKSDAGQQVSPGTLIYRNGAPTTPGGIIGNEPYYDIASVEVLRGPQGTFAGENATGGAIFITEQKPDLDKFGGWVDAQYGNYDDVRVRGAVNIPVTGTLAIRIATNNENRSSFSHVSGTWTGNAGKLHESDWRLGVLWQPIDAFKATLTTDYNYIDFGGTPAAPFTGSTKNIFYTSSDVHLQGIENQVRSVLEMSYEFEGGMLLKSVSSYQLGHIAVGKDVDGTATAVPGIYQSQVSADTTWSEEVNLISPNKGPFNWVLGASYIADKVHSPLGQPQELIYTPFSVFNYGFNLKRYDANKENWGVFGQASYSITDALKFQVGARYSETSFTLNSLTQYSLGWVIYPVLPYNLYQLVQGEQEKDSRLTGKINLEWAVDDENFLYAFVATGHKGGGINGIGLAIAGGFNNPNPPACVTSPVNMCPPTFKPEEVIDYEIGWKGTYFDDHLHTQLGGFYNDYQNFQVAIFDPATNLGQVMNAHGHSTIAGVEAQAQGKFGDFSFDLGLSYLHTALGTFYARQSSSAGTCDSATGGTAANCINLTGRQQPNAAPWTVQAGIQYDFHLDGGQVISPRLDYGMISSRWSTVFEAVPNDRLATQNLFNGQVVYDSGGDWTATLYATNLFNLHYVISQGTLAMPGAPQQYGIRLAKNF
jgi:iron complex outermembrane recepter protein